MGKYIYESHMGGLYCSDEELDYESLYCDSCGDSDWEIGYANSLEEAWEILKDKTDTFDMSKCDSCPHNEDYDYCDSECEENAHSGGYSLDYIMKFLSENFKAQKLHYIYLIPKFIEDTNYILVNCQPKGYKFGSCHSLLCTVSPFENFVPLLARGLCRYLDGCAKGLREIYTEKSKGKVIHVFECIEEKNEELYNEDWRDRASYRGDSWYGYVKNDNINLVEDEKNLEKFIKQWC